MQPWWLDAVCKKDEKWDVLIYEKDGSIQAVWPYVYLKDKRRIVMPLLTQKLGPVFFYDDNQNEYRRLSLEKQAIFQMLNALPKFNRFHQNFDHNISNWQPFYWKGFTQSTRYTYIIHKRDIGNAFEKFESKTKSLIKKANKIVSVIETNNVNDFYSVNKKTFERKKSSITYSLQDLQIIDRCCVENNCRTIFLAKDQQGNVHAGIYLIYDEKNMYYLMGGVDPDFKSSGAASLLIYEGIKYAGKLNRNFDFEGSMIEGVEAFFRSFGAKQVPYFCLTKCNSKLHKIKQIVSEIIR